MSTQDKQKPQAQQPEQSQPVLTSTQSQPEPEQNLTLQQAKTQLKQKTKQYKLLQAKNKKLQSKYIEMFKQQKSLKKDWTVLTTLVREVLPNFQERPVGKYDVEELRELWRAKEAGFVARIQELESGMERFREKVEREAGELAEEKISNTIRESKQKVDAVNRQLQAFKKNSKNLGQQLADYDKKLQSKNDQVSKLTKQKLKLEHTINQMKVKSITDQLSDKKPEEEKINSERNQILSLRHQVSELMHRRDQLRGEVKGARAMVEKWRGLAEERLREIQGLRERGRGDREKEDRNDTNGQSQKQPPTPPPTPTQKKQSISSNSDSSPQKYPPSQQPESQEHHMLGDDEYIHREYMKNVFIRYMKSWANGDQTQTEILLNIILTMLKFDSKERELVGGKKKNWWGLY